MLPNAFTKFTIGFSAYIEKTGVRHLPIVSVFIVLYPNQPIIYGNSPLRTVSIVSRDPFGVACLKNFAPFVCTPDANDPHALREHEDDVARFNLLHVLWIVKVLPDGGVLGMPHQRFVRPIRRISAIR